MRKVLVLTIASLVAVGQVAMAAPKLDPKLKSYKKTSGVSGQLSSIGSDTLNNLMTYWTEGFTKVYPVVGTEVEGKGSSTAPPALIQGTSQLGPMSRKMKSKEEDKFIAKFGYRPTPIRTAIDCLAIYVNKDNPIEGLTIPQADAIFSSTRNKGYASDIATWGQLGITGPLARRPISTYGRNSASGTYGYFKKHVLGKGDYKSTVKEQPGSASVVQGIENDLAGIGYSGIGYITSGVRAVPLAKSGSDFKDPSVENALNGSYPLARFLYVYVNKAPDKPFDKTTHEFIKYVLSKEGQKSVVKDGYIPVAASAAEEDLAKLA